MPRISGPSKSTSEGRLGVDRARVRGIRADNSWDDESCAWRKCHRAEPCRRRLGHCDRYAASASGAGRHHILGDLSEGVVLFRSKDVFADDEAVALPLGFAFT